MSRLYDHIWLTFKFSNVERTRFDKSFIISLENIPFSLVDAIDEIALIAGTIFNAHGVSIYFYFLLLGRMCFFSQFVFCSHFNFCELHVGRATARHDAFIS